MTKHMSKISMDIPAVFAFCFPAKMTSLEIIDIYFVKFDDVNQYVVLISLYLSQTNEIYFWGC